MNGSQRSLDRLAVAVLLRDIITLAQQAPGLTDSELRAGWWRWPGAAVTLPAH